MIFEETGFEGAYIVRPELRADDRGFFTRTFCADEFAKQGLREVMVQSNLSRSLRKFTLRGMHFQVNGAEEAKLVRCTRGRILDVIIDIRKKSKTYCKHLTQELSEENALALYVPEGFAHGFMTLEDNCDVFYQVSNRYTPGSERGIRWNDPLFGIDWPCTQPHISGKDASHPDFIHG
ncbi:MAG TPA: dTDP-4-dehydrorhamnose 3,5-epimerase [Bacteroidia bacterium]|jgi:dTDP-4-dehydrorhamnose 3,5-epimerase|nr:dTDP-4-dehydrorhamnose 3,5-epimerase [Bacteroidia bacterium]